MLGHHLPAAVVGATPARRWMFRVTQKPGSDRALAIALEGVTPDAVSGKPGSAAPRVIASGRGAVAEQILQIAFERGVKVRTDSDLAEILAAVEVDSEIPLAALVGVAEILRYLYQSDADPDDKQPQLAARAQHQDAE